MTNKAKIKEIFTSIQGEGPFIGYKQLFIRFCGCNLSCAYCDTDHDSKGAKIYTPLELIAIANSQRECHSVALTGGEPLLQPDFLIETCKLLKKYNINIALDTSGVGIGKYEEVLKYVDLVILDIKAYEPESYKKITGCDMKEYVKFLDTCTKLNKKLWLRQVIIPNINDNKVYIKGLKERGYKLYLLTNITEASHNYINNQINIDSVFEGGIYSYQEKIVKPNPDIYNLILNRFNLNKDETIFFDDREKNVVAANEVGLKAVVFKTIEDIENNIN